MLAEEDKHAEDKSLDGAWYKRKQTNSGEKHIVLKSRDSLESSPNYKRL